MTSLSRETRQKQLVEWEAKLHKRETLLVEKGFDAIKIEHDIGVKEFKSKIKESQVRLQAIDALEMRTVELAAIKADRLARPKEEVPKAKKTATTPAPVEAKPRGEEEEVGAYRVSAGLALPCARRCAVWHSRAPNANFVQPRQCSRH